MNAIVTVVGEDKVGIIAAVCALLAENNVNILDLSQTILHGAFTMVMAVDVGGSSASIGELRTMLEIWAARWAFPSAFSGRRSLTQCTGSEDAGTALRSSFQARSERDRPGRPVRMRPA